MILVEDLLGLDDVQLVLAGHRPRQRDQPVEVSACDGVLGRLGGHLGQTVELFFGRLACLLRHPGLFDLLLQLVDLVLAFVLLAELLLDRLHLLAQVVLALGLADLVGDLRLDLAGDLLQLELAGDDLDQLLHAVLDVVALEQADLLLGRDVQHGGGEIRQPCRVAGARGQHHLAEIARDVRRDLDELLELVDEAAHERFHLDGLVLDVLDRGDRCLDKRFGGHEAIHTDALEPLDDQVDVVAAELDDLEDPRDGADAVHGAGLRVVVGRVALRDDGDQLAFAHDVVEQVERLPPADRNRHDRVGEQHAVAQWEYPDFAGYFQCFDLTLVAHAISHQSA